MSPNSALALHQLLVSHTTPIVLWNQLPVSFYQHQLIHSSDPFHSEYIASLSSLPPSITLSLFTFIMMVVTLLVACHCLNLCMYCVYYMANKILFISRPTPRLLSFALCCLECINGIYNTPDTGCLSGVL